MYYGEIAPHSSNIHKTQNNYSAAEGSCPLDSLAIVTPPNFKMYRGYFPLWRKIVDWGWYKDSNTKAVFLHLLLTANHKDTDFLGHKIKEGQCVHGLIELSKILGMSPQSIRTSIKHLKSTNEVTTQPTNRFTIYTLNNYFKYLPNNYQSNNPANKQLTNNQQTTNKQLTTSNNDKNNKNDKNIGVPPLTDAEFLSSLKTNTAYKHIDIDHELAKMDSWLSTRPGRKKTRRFIINWLNKVEKPLEQAKKEPIVYKHEPTPPRPEVTEEDRRKVRELIQKTLEKKT